MGQLNPWIQGSAWLKQYHSCAAVPQESTRCWYTCTYLTLAQKTHRVTMAILGMYVHCIIIIILYYVSPMYVSANFQVSKELH